MVLCKEKFGSSSEKDPRTEFFGRLSLFNEAETEADVAVSKLITKDVKGYKRVDRKNNKKS